MRALLKGSARTKIIDLQDTDKSRYFAIPEFNNCFIIRSPNLFFHILITSWKLREAVCHFSFENVVPTAHEQNVICSKTRLDGITHEQTIICRQLFAGHVLSANVKKGKNASNDNVNYFQWVHVRKR